MFRRLARFLALLIGPLPAFASDAPGTADPPGMKRIEGSRILFQSRADHDRLRFALEKLNWIGHEGKLAPFNSASAEGRRLSTYYALPERMMPLEAMRNYEAELRAQGFEILFSGGGEEIQTLGYGNLIARHVLGMTGTYSNPEERAQWPLQNADDRSAAYFAARKTDEKGAETYVSGYFGLYKLGGPWEITRGVVLPAGVAMARIDRLEVKPREQRMVFVSQRGDGRAGRAQRPRGVLCGVGSELDSRRSRRPLRPRAVARLPQQPDARVLVVESRRLAGKLQSPGLQARSGARQRWSRLPSPHSGIARGGWCPGRGGLRRTDREQPLPRTAVPAIGASSWRASPGGKLPSSHRRIRPTSRRHAE